MSAVESPRRITRQRTTGWLFWSQVVIAVVTLGAAFYQLETIVFMGPFLAGVGLVFAMLVRPMGSRAAVVFGLSAPVASALGAFIIAFFQLSPSQARTPILTLLILYLAALMPAGFLIASQLHRWPRHATIHSSRGLRFSMKSLLVVMTIVAFATAALAGLAKMVYDFPLAFGGFGCVMISLVIVIAARTFSLRQRFSPNSGSALRENAFWHWLSGVISGGFWSQKRICSFCGSDYRDSAPFVEGRDGSLICRACVARSFELLQNSAPTLPQGVSDGTTNSDAG